MESEMDGIEVSYNAVGIFSHITADGENAWTISQPTRNEVMMRMMRAIKRWPLESRRNINYRYKNRRERERIFQNSIWTKGALIGLVYKNCSSIECRGLLVIYVFICNTCISFRFFMDLTSNFCITSLSGCLTSSNSFLCTVLFECCNFCYRSFGPILNLLKAFDTPAAQYWAVWALCNLTRVYRKCKLFFLEEMEVLKTAWWLRGLVSWKIFSTYFL